MSRGPLSVRVVTGCAAGAVDLRPAHAFLDYWQQAPRRYDGHTSCPLVTGYGRLVRAGFDYDRELQERFPIDHTEELCSKYALKAYELPHMHRNGMLNGRL